MFLDFGSKRVQEEGEVCRAKFIKVRMLFWSQRFWEFFYSKRVEKDSGGFGLTRLKDYEEGNGLSGLKRVLEDRGVFSSKRPEEDSDVFFQKW